MALQITKFVDDLRDILFQISVYDVCEKHGEPVNWTIRHRWFGAPRRLQYAIFREDCHIRIRHNRGHEGEPELVERPK